MTLTDSTTRTYAVGDSSDSHVWASRDERAWCNHRIGFGYRCSLPEGHTGPQHVAANQNTVVGIDDRDTSGDAPTTPEWQVGDVVRCTTYGIVVGVVVGVETRETGGERRVHVVGRGANSSQIVHRRYSATELERYSGDLVAPTLPEIGAALIRPYESIGMRDEAPATDQALTAEIERLRAQVDHEKAELERWKVDVRDKAITYAKRHDWCSVVDQALREMGLDPMRRKYSVEVSVTARQTVYVTVEDDSDQGEDWVREQVDTYAVRNAVSSYEWRIEDSDDWEIEGITESDDD